MKRESYRSGEKALTPSQVDLFLSVITDVRDLAMFQLAINAGLRRDDLVNVNKQDIDFTGKRLVFREKKKGRIYSVPLSDKTLNSIQMVLNAFKTEKGKRLFPISSKTAYNRFQMYLKRCGLPSRPIHALRATTVKLCQANGWTPEQTAKLLGDKVQTIQEHYSTPSDLELDEAMKERGVF